jgi:predicted nucleotidyltransferase
MIPNAALPALRELDLATVTLNVPYLLVGATARILICDDRVQMDGRATSDLDFGVCTENWDHYDALRSELLRGRFRADDLGIEHRLRHGDGMKFDLVPFGGSEDESRHIEWPRSRTRMDVTGFREAYADADGVRIDRDLTLKVASLRGLMVLKAIAYEDRRVRSVFHDLDDLEFVLQNIAGLFDEARVFEEANDVLVREIVAYSEAPAYCLGRDIGSRFQGGVTDDLERVAARLGDPDDEELRDLIRRRAVPSAVSDAAEAAARWRALALGIVDGRVPGDLGQ